MGTATNSPPAMALEKKQLACSELAGCTRFFSGLHFYHRRIGGDCHPRRAVFEWACRPNRQAAARP